MFRLNKFLFVIVTTLLFLFFFQLPITADANGKIKGYGLVQPVNVYESPSREAPVLKAYNYNTLITYENYSEDWYTLKVYVDGITYKGYINKNDVGELKNSKNVKGVTLDNINVYSSTSTKSKVLKSYRKGSIIQYRGYNNDWFIATVYVNGKKHEGYIPIKNIETIVTEQQNIQGVGVKSPTKFYAKPSTNSKVLKSYPSGRILKYRTYTKSWYEATVHVNGKKHTAYVSSKDVEPVNESIQVIEGISLKTPTKVYSSPSKSAKVLKSYPNGKILKYRPYSKNWFQATVILKGKKHTGYISKQDVEEVTQDKQNLRGVGIKQTIPVYSLASKDSKVLKSYKYGSILKYQPLSTNWYKATVYVKGKEHTGFISKNDVDNNLNQTLEGYAVKNTINVYRDTSKKAKILKSYKKGKLLKYRPYNSNWFIATVYVNGKEHTGYISTSDVSPYPPTLQSNAVKNPTNVYSKPSRNSTVLKSYKKGKTLKFKVYNNQWYEATVYVKGKKKTGYIHVNDVGPIPFNKDNAYDIPILMYHQIGENVKPNQYGIFVSAKNFEEQMKYLKSAGYTPIHFDEFHKIKNIKKPIIITFDDGLRNNMIAYDILKNLEDNTFKPKATIFMIGSRIGRSQYLTEEQIKEISDSGIISIQSHTMTHPFFNDKENTGSIDLTEEIRGSKLLLEEITGKKVTAFAYPYGSYNSKVIDEVKKYYDYAVTTKSGIANTKDNSYELVRVRVSFDTTLEEFKKMIVK